MMRMTQLRRKAEVRFGHHGSSRVYMLWIVVCVQSSVRAQAKSSNEWSLESTFHGLLFNPLASPEVL
eukprot:319647-Amphidinium_carterae.2